MHPPSRSNRYVYQLVQTTPVNAAHAIQIAFGKIWNTHFPMLTGRKLAVEMRRCGHVSNRNCASLIGTRIRVRSVDQIQIEQNDLPRLDFDRLLAVETQCPPIEFLIEGELAGIDGAVIE